MNSIFPKNKQKSQVIVVVIIIVGAVMVISLTLATLMFAELKNQRNLTYSLAAQYAAESGIERGIKDLTGGTCSPNTHVDLGNKAKADYQCGDTTPPSTGIKKITSTGEMFGVKRKYEVEVYDHNVNAEGGTSGSNIFLRPKFWREVSP